MNSLLDAKAHFDAQYHAARHEHDPHSALQLAQSLLTYSQQAHNPNWCSISQRLIAKCQKQIGERAAAIQTLQAAIRYAKRHQLMQQTMHGYDELGTVLYEQLAYYPALDAWLKSLEIATLLQAMHGCVRAYIGVGKVHFAFGDHHKALHFYQTAHSLCQPLDDIELNCEVSLNLAACLYRLGEHDQALFALSQISQHILNDLNQPEWEAEVLTYDGLIHLHFERFSVAQELLSQAYQRFRKTKHATGQGQVMQALARCFVQLKQLDLAEECLLEAARLGAEFHLPTLAAESHTALAQLYLDSGQYQQALEHRKQLHHVIAGQSDERGFPLQLSSKTQTRLRRIERELENRKTKLRLQQFVLQ
ncbi:tetratricopeptide repeat protein [Chitinibacter sp. SCUT-21]|uniref:tetratricopeptide repeat protein n=1 Tax=Chitinibacter sp. SCUT-21 TaxID=2970891 RepID=UPI0035A608C2